MYILCDEMAFAYPQSPSTRRKPQAPLLTVPPLHMRCFSSATLASRFFALWTPHCCCGWNGFGCAFVTRSCFLLLSFLPSTRLIVR